VTRTCKVVGSSSYSSWDAKFPGRFGWATGPPGSHFQ
jgi:hypothetical protein